MIAIVDYGMGNLKSVANAFELIGASVKITSDRTDLCEAAAIVIPGVGAFGDGMDGLAQRNLIETLNEEVTVRKKPFLGICLGMQFLAAEGFEHGRQAGLGWIGGTVRPIESSDRAIKVPHMGWNEVKVARPGLLLDGVGESVFYFVHGYYLEPSEGMDDAVTSTCWHGLDFPATIERDNIFGVQFHPEKSQQAGLQLLRNFAKLS